MTLIALAEESGLRPKLVAQTNGGEYHSACPSCGGTDRFILHPNQKMKNCAGFYWCRQCNIKGDSIQFAKEYLGLSFKEAVERVQAIMPKRSNFNNILAHKKNLDTQMKYEQLIPPNQQWTKRALEVVNEAHRVLLDQSEILKILADRGIPVEAVKQYKIGYNPTDVWDKGADWGQQTDNIWRPMGILIPFWHKTNPIRLKIRRLDYKEGDSKPKFVIIPGGMNGLNVIGGFANKTVIIVESELDAYAMHYTIPDRGITFIAVGGSTKNPDNASANIAKGATNLLVCHDNDEGGMKMLHKWQMLFPCAKAISTPIGKDIGEAIQNGFDIKSWIENILLPKESKSNPSEIVAPVKVQPLDRWSKEDSLLINWFLNEKRLPLTPFTLTTKEHGIEGVNDPESYYIVLRAAITGGPNTWEARTRRLQEILYLIKDLVDQNK